MSKCDVMPQQQQRPASPMSIAGVDGGGTAQSGGSSSSRVRRILFGRAEPEESLRFAKDELEKQMRLDQEKWNFDFLNERPLNGPGKRYHWVKVGGSDGPDAAVPEHVNGTCTVHDDRNGGPDGQTYITDFMRKRKHASPQHKHLNGTLHAADTSSSSSPSDSRPRGTESSSSPT